MSLLTDEPNHAHAHGVSRVGSLLRSPSGSAMDPRTWDGWFTHRELIQLTLRRTEFRVRRLLDRLRSPKRLLATILSLSVFLMYLAYGILVLSQREPTSPEKLQLWLSGGMVLYAIYHGVKCVWTTRVPDLDLTAAERLWLGGAPIRPSSLAVYHLGDVVAGSTLKTVLLVIVLYVDVSHVPLLAVSVFTSLMLLELTRLILQRVVAAMNVDGQRTVRIAVTSVAIAVAVLFLTRLIQLTPHGSAPVFYVLNGFRSIGDVASNTTIQSLSLPWRHASRLAVVDGYGMAMLIHLIGAAAMLPLAVMGLVGVDRWSAHQIANKEKLAWRKRRQAGSSPEQQRDPTGQRSMLEGPSMFESVSRWIPQRYADSEFARQLAANVARQAISVHRYRGEIAFSFLLPTALCLSLLAINFEGKPWLDIIAGVAACTVLLAPPALRLDFRRDLKRMLLLRGLPVSPMAMTLGQLTLPVLITVSFQWFVVIISAWKLQMGWMPALEWLIILPAIAIATFASENTLYLTYPHHESAQGIAMILRTKLVFLGKFTVMFAGGTLLAFWSRTTKLAFTGVAQEGVYLLGAAIAIWGLAIAAVHLTAWTWGRFDLAGDAPPE